MTQFGTIYEDGSYEPGRTIPQSAMAACPHVIMVPEHYREDCTCKCNDPNEKVLGEWGYEWSESEKLWVAPSDVDL